MENAATTLLEDRRFIFDHTRTPLKYFRRAYIMLHELAHMWFGDTITPYFWNDLWLKEGYATFLGYKALINDKFL